MSAAEVARIVPDLERLQPWMHQYKLADDVFTGYFKHHGFSETVCTPNSRAGLADEMRAAFADYMAGQPFEIIDRALAAVDRPAQALSFLDIACATGKYSLELARQGALSVRGVEPRELQVEQARLIQHADTRFRDAPIAFDHVPESADDPGYLAGETYDVVLSLGLLYHLTDPAQHLANLRRLARRMAVVHTMTHPGPAGLWSLALEDRGGITKALEGVGWTPYFRDVKDLLLRVGFDRVEIAVHPQLVEVQRRWLDDDQPPGLAARAAQYIPGRFRAPRLEREWQRQATELEAILRRFQNPNCFTYLAFVDEGDPEGG